MLKHHAIICISSIDWDFLWQAHQEIMSTFAQHGNDVLFIDNTGVRSPRLSDLPRLRHRLRNWRRGIHGFRKEREHLYIYSPLVLPFPYSKIAQWINKRILVSAIHSWMRSVNFHDPILWTFLPTNVSLSLAQAINHRLFVYYCMDNFSATSPEARKVVKTEHEIIRRADLVFAMSGKLVEYCRQFRDDIIHIPMGVNAELFDRARGSDTLIPGDLSEVRRPIIGYIGGVRRSIDKTLVMRVAEARKDWSLVFVGPLQTDVSDLTRFRNIKFLGVKTHAEIPHYIQSFDCCILPYIKDSYTDSVCPAKLHEYLMMGKPVVSTNLAEAKQYTDYQTNGHLVYVANDNSEFIQCIHKALSEQGEYAEQRIALARTHSWSGKIEAMSTLIETRLVLKERQTEDLWRDRLTGVYDRYRRGRRKMAAWVIGLAAAYLIAFHTPLLWKIGEPLKLADVPTQADAIVVLAGGVGEAGQVGKGYEERVQYAVALYQQGLAPQIVFSSGYSYALQEAYVMQALAVSLGVPEKRIRLETDGRNTAEQVHNVVRILRAHDWNSVLLVSSPYHMRRLALVWRKQAPELEAHYTPILTSRFYRAKRAPSLRQLRGIIHEYLAIFYYWFRGWL